MWINLGLLWICQCGCRIHSLSEQTTVSQLHDLFWDFSQTDDIKDFSSLVLQHGPVSLCFCSFYRLNVLHRWASVVDKPMQKKIEIDSAVLIPSLATTEHLKSINLTWLLIFPFKDVVLYFDQLHRILPTSALLHSYWKQNCHSLSWDQILPFCNL